MAFFKTFLVSKVLFRHSLIMPRQSFRPSSNLAEFRKIYATSKNIVALTGAGISAESGVPTFRGTGGLWRKYRAQELATAQSFVRNPSLVWEFYSYRRELGMLNIKLKIKSNYFFLVLAKKPNPAHIALAEAEKRLKNDGRSLVIITQNIDELHERAGNQNVIELHGTLFKTFCTKCGDVATNHDSPICEALRGKGDPDPNLMDSKIPIEDLPHCKRSGCNGLLRPHVVWFGEQLEEAIIDKAQNELNKCDLCLVVNI